MLGKSQNHTHAPEEALRETRRRAHGRLSACASVALDPAEPELPSTVRPREREEHAGSPQETL